MGSFIESCEVYKVRSSVDDGCCYGRRHRLARAPASPTCRSGRHGRKPLSSDGCTLPCASSDTPPQEAAMGMIK